jgi:hypothetical protein
MNTIFDSFVLVRTSTQAAIEEHSTRRPTEHTVTITDDIKDDANRTLGLAITILILAMSCAGFSGKARGSIIILSDGFDELIITMQKGSI